MISEKTIIIMAALYLLIFGSTNAAEARQKSLSQVPCSAGSKNLSFAAMDPDAKFLFLNRFNFMQGEGFTEDKVVLDFYAKACASRIERLSEHRVPMARIMGNPEQQSLWIDNEGNVEFDAWETSMPKEQGLKILRILQDKSRRNRAAKAAKEPK